MKRLIGLNVAVALAAAFAVLGASISVAEDLAVYAEVSGISDEDSTGDDIVNFGGKIGAKFLF